VLVKFSADVIILKGEEIKNQKKSSMCNKGESRSTNDVKKNAPHVKLMGTYNLEKKKVNVFNFGMNTAGNRTMDAVQDIDNSLKVWDIACDNKVYLDGQCIYAGGGGTRDDLHIKLETIGRIDDVDREYCLVTCSFHGLNLTLSVPVEEYLGKGGIDSQTMIQ